MNSVDHGGVGYGFRGSVNIPIIEDKLAVRISGFDRRDAGFVDNPAHGQDDVNSLDVTGGRISLLWRPVDAVSLKLGALVQDTKGNGSAEIDANYQLKPTIGDLDQNRLPGTGVYHQKSQLYTSLLTVDLGKVDLTSVTGYGINHYTADLDQTGTYGGDASYYFGVSGANFGDDFETKKVSQEVRLSSHAGGMFDWLVGGFYTHEKTAAGQTIGAIDPTSGVNEGYLYNGTFPSSYTEYAGFADVTAHLTSKFDIQVGGRYSKNTQIYNEDDGGAYYGPVNDILPTATSKDHAFTYLVTPSYKITPDTLIYARVASGYRPGGPNPGASFGFPGTFKADKTVNGEVGIKGFLFSKILSYDASVYYIDWTNIQIQNRDPRQRSLCSDGSARPRRFWQLPAELNRRHWVQTNPPAGPRAARCSAVSATAAPF